jgi:hypothetical protein
MKKKIEKESFFFTSSQNPVPASHSQTTQKKAKDRNAKKKDY